jgi:hypothetical protein
MEAVHSFHYTFTRPHGIISQTAVLLVEGTGLIRLGRRGQAFNRHDVDDNGNIVFCGSCKCVIFVPRVLVGQCQSEPSCFRTYSARGNCQMHFHRRDVRNDTLRAKFWWLIFSSVPFLRSDKAAAHEEGLWRKTLSNCLCWSNAVFCGCNGICALTRIREGE